MREALAAHREVDAIRRLLLEYARGVDRHDWDLVRACFHEDATDTHDGTRRTVDELLADMQHRHRTCESSLHYVTNDIIEVLGADLAHSEAYCLVFVRHRRLGRTAAYTRTVRCRYLDRIERREGGGWRLAEREVVYDHVSTERSESLLGLLSVMTHGAAERVRHTASGMRRVLPLRTRARASGSGSASAGR